MDFEEIYEVEDIIERKDIPFGKVLYLLKWKNWSHQYNTWELEENLECPELIQAFERRLASATPSRKSSRQTNDKLRKQARLHGFARGLTAKEVVGVAVKGEEIYMLMKWVEKNEADIVPAKQANLICPHIVLDYYERVLTWKPPDDGDYQNVFKELEGKTIDKKINESSNGFKKRLTAKRIITAAENKDGDLTFLMEWKEAPLTDFVTAEEAAKECPQVVITFFEEQLILQNSNNEK